MTNPYLDLMAEEEARVQSTDATAFEPLPETPKNPYLDLVDNDAAIERARLQSSLRLGIARNPDEAAKTQALAEKFGLPEDVVARNLQRIDIQAAVDAADAKLRTSPKLAERMRDPLFAAKAHDDIDTLTAFETSVRFLKNSGRALAASEGNTNAALWGLAQMGTDLISDMATGPLSRVTGMPDFAAALSERFTAYRKESEARAARVRGSQEGAGFVEKSIYSGFESLGTNLLTLPLSILTGNPVPSLGAMGAITTGTEYGKAADKNVEPAQAAIFALSQGAIEVATETIPMSRLLGDIAQNTGLVRMAARQLAAEIPGEQLATILQDMNEWATLKPEAPLSEYIAERPNAAVQTLISTIVSAGGQSAVVKGVQAAVEAVGKRQEAAQRAETDAKVMAEMNKLAESSALRERDPKAFAEFVQQAAEESGSPAEVFIDAQTLAQTLAQANITPEEAGTQLPSITSQLAAASASGGDVRIPLGEFTAATEMSKLLMQHARTSPDAISQEEAKQIDAAQAMREQAEKVLVEQAAESEMAASAEQVRGAIFAQLEGAKRFTPDVNAAYADFVRDFYTVQAGRLGIAPADLYARYPLKIQATSVTGPSLEQGAPNLQDAGKRLPETQAKLAASKIRGDDGALLRLYHGTTEDDFTAFDLAHEYDNRGVAGVWLSDSHNYAYDMSRGGWDSRKRGSGGTIVHANIASTNPRVFDVLEEARRLADEIGVEAPTDSAEAQQLLSGDDAWDSIIADVVETAKAEGHDALIIRNFNDGRMVDSTAYIAFDPSDVVIEKVESNDPSAPLSQGTGDRGAFSPSTSTITLLQNADLSTFLHESGHFYLEVLADLASQPGAPTEIQADMAKILEWFGVPDLSTWRAMTLDEQRPYHEQFARGFEAYLFEGKAPSMGLQPLFQRFRSWLIAVYKSLQALNVTLTDDVRGVFDRMLASEEAIKTAQAARRYAPLFKSAEEAGMTPEEWTAYQTLGADSTEAGAQELQTRSLRDMRWLTGARGRALKTLQKDAAVKRKAVQAEVEAEVQRMPVYAARRLIQRGLRPGDTEPSTTPQRLGIPQMKEVFGADDGWTGLGYGQYGLLANEGAHPDIVAQEVGFTSGDEMVRELLTAQPYAEVVEGMTDQRMLERYGDIADAQALERAADEAVHNDARGRFVATELAALDKAVGKPRVLVAAAKEFAANIIARKKVRDIKPGQFAAAAARASREAEKSRKDIVAAATAKRNQLLQHYAARTAHDALTEVDKAVEYLRKFEREATRKNLDLDYLEQIDTLLDRFDLRKSTSLKAIDKRKSLAQWVEAQEAAGLTPVIDEHLLDEARRTSYKEITLEEFRGLVDAVRNIEHLGRLKKKLLTARDKREFAAIVDAAAASIQANGGKVKPLPLETRTGVIPWLQGFWASHRKISSLMRQMDGGKDDGILYDILVRPMNEAGTREEVMTEQATMKLAELYKPVLAQKGGLKQKVYIPAIKASMTRAGRLSIALNWGNPANRQRVMDGDNWTEQQVQAILATLTKTDLQFVNDTWAFIDSFWPDVKAKQLRVSGVVEDKVEAVPFVATTNDGTQVAMRGGYYPLKYDRDRSSRAEAQEAAETAKDMVRGAFTRATTRRGHTKARVETVKRPVRKDLNVITQHVTEVIHDLAWHEWIIDANRLLSAKPITGAIRDHYGPDVERTLKDGLMGIATADIVPQTRTDQALMHLRSNVSRATMGVSFTTALLQPFGLTQSMVRIGAANVLRGAARWGGDAVRFRNSLTWIEEKSDFMRLRGKSFNREIREISGRVGGKSKTMQVLDGGLFMLMRKMQMVADVPTWIGQYEKSLRAGADEASAVAAADRAVIEAQGGGQIKDMAEIQRKHPMLTQFYSYFSVTLNLTIESTARTDFKNPAAVAGWLSDMALLLVVPAILPAALLHMLRGGEDEDEEEWVKRLLKWQAGYLLGMVVGARELSGAVSGFDYAGPPVGRVITDLGKAAQQAGQGEVDEPAIMATTRLMGSAFGIPTVQAIRSYRGWEAWADDDAPATAILLGPPPKD